MKLRETLAILLIILLQSTISIAQEKDETLVKCDVETALQLVEDQVLKVKKKTDSERTIKVQLRAAEFTWKINEQASRKYYKDSFEGALKHFEEKGFEKVDMAKESAAKVYIIKPDYRFEVIQSIAIRDSKWADTLIKKVLKEYDKEFQDRKINNKFTEPQKIAYMASEFADKNPQFSKQLFEIVMQYPLESYWYYALQNITYKNTTLGDEIYIRLLNRYQNEMPSKLLFLSAYPFARQRILGVDKFQYGTIPANGFSPNMQLQIAFTEVFFNRINQLANNPQLIGNSTSPNALSEPAYMLSGLNDMEDYIRNDLPQLLPIYSAAKSKSEALLNADQRKSLEARQNLYSKSALTFDERLEEVQDKDNEGKLTDNDIIGLVFNVRELEDFEKIETWLDKLKDEKIKNPTINFFYHKRAKAEIKEENFDVAKKYADKLPELEFRASLYFDIVGKQLKSYNDSYAVRQNLQEVSDVAKKTEDSIVKAQVLLGIANMYEEADLHFESLGEISEAVRVINKLENPDIFSSFMYRKIVGKTFAYVAGYSTPGYNMETAFKSISKNDFDLTLAHARSLEDSYLQTLAVLAVATNCVDNSKKKDKEKQRSK